MKNLLLVTLVIFLVSCGGAPGPKKQSGYSVGITQQHSTNNFTSSVEVQKSFPVTMGDATTTTSPKTNAPPHVGPFRQPPPRNFLVYPKSQRQAGNPTQSKLPKQQMPTPAPMQSLPGTP